MKLHRNAKTTPVSRLALVRRVLHDRWSYQAVADGYGVSVRTVAKWVGRFREFGRGGLEDGSSRPRETRFSAGVRRRGTFLARLDAWTTRRTARPRTPERKRPRRHRNTAKRRAWAPLLGNRARGPTARPCHRPPSTRSRPARTCRPGRLDGGEAGQGGRKGRPAPEANYRQQSRRLTGVGWRPTKEAALWTRFPVSLQDGENAVRRRWLCPNRNCPGLQS